MGVRRRGRRHDLARRRDDVRARLPGLGADPAARDRGCARRRARAASSVALGVRDRLLFVWALGTGVPLLGVLVVGIVGVTKSGVDTGYVAAACLFLGGVALVAGLLATLFAARAIADPVTVGARRPRARRRAATSRPASRSTTAARSGCCRPASTAWPRGCASASSSATCSAARSATTSRARRSRNGTRLGGEEREVGVLFVDVVGSTSMALAMPPTEVVRLLNHFFRVVVETRRAARRPRQQVRGRRGAVRVRRPRAERRPRRRRAARGARDWRDRLPARSRRSTSASASRRARRGGQRRRRAALRVHGDRRPRQRGGRLSALAKQRDGGVLSSEAALRRVRGLEGSEWTLDEFTILPGRSRAHRDRGAERTGRGFRVGVAAALSRAPAAAHHARQQPADQRAEDAGEEEREDQRRRRGREQEVDRRPPASSGRTKIDQHDQRAEPGPQLPVAALLPPRCGLVGSWWSATAATLTAPGRCSSPATDA